MAERIAAFDWASTPLGPMDTWPQSLCTSVRMILGSRYPMFIWWGEHLIKFYNDAYSVVLGQRHPAALGQPASKVWSDIWEIVGAQADLVVKEGKSTWNQQLLLEMSRNGYWEETYFTFSYSPVADDGGAISGVFCACTEDTAQVLAARRLRTLRELASETAPAESMESACALAAEVLTRNRHDIPFALIYLRDAAAGVARLTQATGVDAGSAIAPLEIPLQSEQDIWPIGRSSTDLPDIVVENDADRYPQIPGGPWPEPARKVAICRLAHSGQDEPAGFLVIGLSPRLAYDDEYRGFLNLLARSVTTALDNARAYDMERRRAEDLARLNRAKSVFFSNVSHEFRTPLTLLLGPLRDLQKHESPGGDGTRESLALMERNALRLQKMVNTLLDFSRLEAGQVSVQLQSIDLGRYTAELASVFRSAVERAGLSFDIDCPSLSEPIPVDSEMWEKIILNLLSNALKFTTDGRISVRLHDAGDAVRVTVSDTGIGIPADELPKVFDRFYRVESEGGRTHEGTGIGLALVRELVQLHGGTVAAQSTPRVGTSFTVTIPRNRGASKPVPHFPARTSLSQRTHFLSEVEGWLPVAREPSITYADSTAQHETRAASQTPRPRVLLVDDNSDMREYAGRLLSEQFEVEAVRNGADALAAISRRLPDCVITDVMMPGMTGFELLAKLRADPATSALPVIVLSARAGEEARIEGLQAGADAYLVKPFSARELLVTVTGHIEIAKVRAEARERERELRTDIDIARRDAITILDSISDPFYALDREFRFVYLNGEFEKLAHCKREALVGRNIFETYPSVKGTVFEAKFRQAMQDQRPVHFEAQSLVNHSWLEVQAYPSPDRLAVTFRDISARRAAMREALFVSALNEILRTSKSPQEVLDRATRHTGEEFQVSRCSYARIDDTGDYVIIDQDYSNGVGSIAGRHQIDSFGPALGVDLKRGETLAIEDILQDARSADEASLKAFAAIQVRATLVVPLIKGGMLVSVFVLSHKDPRVWTPDDVHYAEQAADRIWLAFEAANTAQALHDREERLRLASRATNDAIWDWDLQTHAVEWNEAVEKLFGYDVAEVSGTGKWWGARIHPDDRERVLNGIYSAIRGTAEHWTDEYRFVRKDGSEAYIFDRGYVLRDPHGKAVRMIGAMQDLTSRKRAEEALRASEQRYRAVFNQQFQFMAILSGTGVTLEINELPLRAAGYSREQILGVPFWDSPFWSMLPEMRRSWPARLKHAAESDVPILSEDQYNTESGEIRVADAALTAVRNPNGGVEFFIVQANDITERKHAEAERDKLLQNLKQNDRRKDEFLAMLAHELRNPLAAIRSAVSLNAVSSSTEDRRWSDDVISRQVRQLARLVDDLLDVSRITQDKIRLKKERVDALAVLDRAVDVVRPLMQERQHRLSVNYDTSAIDLELEVDPARLEQVVVNLLTNSAKYTERGGTITLEAHVDRSRTESDAEACAVITVTDNGMGIPPDRVAEMFELFAQGERSMARSEGGLGLGLTIVRKLVEMHGGMVEAFSDGPGTGSKFTIRMPLPHAAASSNDALASAQIEEQLSPIAVGAEVLVVDDNVDTAEGLARLLRRSGYGVHMAHDGVAALTLAGQHSPKFVLLDIGLPGKDGYEVASELRQLTRAGDTVLIAISGYGQDEDISRSKQAGFHHHLVKPVDFDELKSLLAGYDS